MTQFRKLNLIVGWSIFLIATITFALTIEPTTSLWDCGEFIASAYKFEVGHPPGAPFFMIVAKVFSLLSFGKVTQVAKMMNMLSALSSSFTILFLFWSITHIAKKLVKKITNTDKLKTEHLIIVLGSGAVGALAYAFSDTFWFSAVEAEVYAMSSLFTAVVFWAILKWENVAHEKYADRWIILIAFLMGLSIGVHLLNLLAIPAIALVYYFKKYKVTPFGIILTIGISFLTLVFIMYGIIQGLVVFASGFERLFVNSFHLPFNSGFIFYLIALMGLLVLGIYLTHRFKRPLFNTIFLAFTVIVIGYSSFALVVIRSSANPPMDENNPENAFALKAYLNREQYGDRPLMKGHYYNARPIERIDNYTYIQGKSKDGKDKYIKIKKTNPTYKYEPENSTLFPRMYSSDNNHIQAYRTWGNVRTEPNMLNNIKFFLSYQVGHMYFRYFMWNFAGRQNDEQGHGGYQKGNWISGIGILDGLRLGSQKNITTIAKEKATRNNYYLLPLILGLIGILVIAANKPKDFWVVMTLFFMTGIAIVLYLNQTPYQPRERDYAYAGSFYAFTIFIGLGVVAIYDLLKRIDALKKTITPSVVAVGIAILIPVLMFAQNYDDHDRSGRYFARDMARNYLNSCAPNAILFTYGDNDTFPLWYAQEVEGIRTDIRVVNLSLLSTDWYIDQMKRKAYTSDTLPISFTHAQFRQGIRDYTTLEENNKFLFNQKFKANFYKLGPEYERLYNSLLEIVDISQLPRKDQDILSVGYEKLNIKIFEQYLSLFAKKEIITKYSVNPDDIKQLTNEYVAFIKVIKSSPAPVDAIVSFIASDAEHTKSISYGCDFIPSRSMLIPVDKEKVIANGTVPEEYQAQIVDAITWSFSKDKDGFYKSNIIILDILAHNNWERPIYFASSVGADNYMGLAKYFQLEGFAYRLVPFRAEGNKQGDIGSISSDILYDNVMNKFTWGRLQEDDFHVDHYVDRVLSIMDLRDVYHRLAEKLIIEGKNQEAIEVLDKCVEVLPNSKKQYDHTVLPIIEDYYKLEQYEKANKIVRTTYEQYKEELDYYSTLNGERAADINMEKRFAVEIIKQLYMYAIEFKQEDIALELMPVIQRYDTQSYN